MTREDALKVNVGDTLFSKKYDTYELCRVRKVDMENKEWVLDRILLWNDVPIPFEHCNYATFSNNSYKKVDCDREFDKLWMIAKVNRQACSGFVRSFKEKIGNK